MNPGLASPPDETYQLNRRRGRRTISLRLSPDGQLQVLAPHWAPRYAIDSFIQREAAWIIRQKTRWAMLRETHPPKRFATGERYWVDGREVPLLLLHTAEIGALPVCELHEGSLRLTVAPDASPDVLRETLRQWYRARTLLRVRAAVEGFAPRLPVTERRLSIGNQKTRWGSCSSRGNLRFNWRLTLMPPEMLEYVVVHELAHLKVMNHSPLFWAVVHSLLPDYKTQRTGLRRFARGFGMDGFA